MQNSRKILGVLLVAAATVTFLISLRTMKAVDWTHVPIPNYLTRAGSYARSLSKKLLHTFGGDENSPNLTTADVTTETTTLTTEQTAAVGFEHTEVFKRFVTQQPGNHTDVAEYLASVKAYLVGFTSPMIRRTATEYSWPETEEETRQRQSRSNSSGKAVKRIVWHNCPTSRRDWPDVVSSHCPVKDCHMSYHYVDHHQAAAVVFWMKGISTLPPRDHDNQVYVFYNMESPINTDYNNLLKPENSVFNWTWNYRLDSDVFNPQDYLRQSLSIPSHSQLLKRMQRKTKMIAWFVSHCNTQSKREAYVKKLQKVVPVDIYGGCGPLKCVRKNSTSCVSKLNDYFFYLSFENSICKEYITEKYYNTFYPG